MPVALGAAGLMICGGVWWLLRNVGDQGRPSSTEIKGQKAQQAAASPPANTTVAAPELDPIDDLTVDDERPVIGRARLKNGESAEGVRYSLRRPAPRGAQIDAETGEFRWQPSRVKPGDYPLIIEARRPGAASPAAVQFTVHVVTTDPPLERLLSELAADGVKVEFLPEGFSTPFEKWLAAPSRVLRVGDEQLNVFVYDAPEAAAVAAAQIAPDLSAVAGRQNEWRSSASCFRRGRLIMLYAGEVPSLYDALTERLGEPLAKCVASDKRQLAAGGSVSMVEQADPASAKPDASPTSTPGEDDLADLVELYQAKKLFVRKEYPALRKIFAKRFEREQQAAIAAAVTDKEKPPAWLQGRDDFKEELFTAFDSAHDDVGAGLKLVTRMQEAFPDKFDSYGELAIAVAVTWDKPRSVYDYAWHAKRCQAPVPDELLDALGNVEYLLDAESAMQGRAQYLPWEFLVLVVNHKTPRAEREWAIASYLLQRAMYGRCYGDVPYDDLMLSSGDKQCRLAGKSYTLENLRRYGGVCAMQADFAARVGQSLGVPALYVGGEGNSGGLHAWVVWVELKAVNKSAISFSIESHGRYRDDQYFVGHLTDPRTSEPTTDRELELRLHSVGVNPQNQRHARLAMRAFPHLRDKLAMDAGEQIRYLAKVTGLCPWNEDAWLALADMARSHTAGKAQSKALTSAVDRLFTTFADFPDFTWKVFDSLVAFQEDIRPRNKLYERLVALYELAGRPDLACEARLKLSDYQVEAGDQGQAIQGLAYTIKKFPGEGRYVPRMLDKLETLAKDLKGGDAEVVQFYQEFLPLVPQKRDKTPTPYCLKMYKRAIERFKQSGQVTLAQTWSAQLALLEAQANL
ncbi:MAG TPA: hypothetical protein VG826_27775 [Pirellulales bacterium]|nr:hypothetical protein [Pirellulales bacterium]